jgi:small subunit ribosomal protein S6
LLSAFGSPTVISKAIPRKGGIPMRDYELTIVVQPDLDDTAFTEVVNRVNGWITENGGEVAKTELWGKRKLAYPIRKQTEGYYALFYVKMPAQFGIELERNLRFLEPVMRFLLIVK